MSEVIIPLTVQPPPKSYEISAAYLLADYFKQDVRFVERTIMKSPDFLIIRDYWELKRPSGDGKRTIQRTLQNAMKQANNLIIDVRGARMNQSRMKRELQAEFCRRPGIKRLLLITKSGDVVEFYK